MHSERPAFLSAVGLIMSIEKAMDDYDDIVSIFYSCKISIAPQMMILYTEKLFGEKRNNKINKSTG